MSFSPCEDFIERPNGLFWEVWWTRLYDVRRTKIFWIAPSVTYRDLALPLFPLTNKRVEFLGSNQQNVPNKNSCFHASRNFLETGFNRSIALVNGPTNILILFRKMTELTSNWLIFNRVGQVDGFDDTSCTIASKLSKNENKFLINLLQILECLMIDFIWHSGQDKTFSNLPVEVSNTGIDCFFYVFFRKLFKCPFAS